MKARNGIGFLFLMVMAAAALSINPAFAHRFNVALVIPLSKGVSKGESVEGSQIRNGFMLATAERDGHPDQESDGHLGGLDVYVTVIDGKGDVAAGLGRIAAKLKPDIVAAFGSESTLSRIGRLLDGKNIALLLPGQSPFSRSGQPAVAAFISTYEKKFGGKPSARAAGGYNAARRIDVAVRAQGGADDAVSLLRSFRQTAHGFAW